MEDAGGDAADKDLGVLWVHGSPLRIKLIDDNVVVLTLFLAARIVEQSKVRLIAGTILGVSTRETNCISNVSPDDIR